MLIKVAELYAVHFPCDVQLLAELYALDIFRLVHQPCKLHASIVRGDIRYTGKGQSLALLAYMVGYAGELHAFGRTRYDIAESGQREIVLVS